MLLVNTRIITSNQQSIVLSYIELGYSIADISPVISSQYPAQSVAFSLGRQVNCGGVGTPNMPDEKTIDSISIIVSTEQLNPLLFLSHSSPLPN